MPGFNYIQGFYKAKQITYTLVTTFRTKPDKDMHESGARHILATTLARSIKVHPITDKFRRRTCALWLLHQLLTDNNTKYKHKKSCRPLCYKESGSLNLYFNVFILKRVTG